LAREDAMREPRPELPDAARGLVVELRGYARRRDVVVLAPDPDLAPLADDIARSLEAPRDLFLVWPLVTPGAAGRQIGAVASGGVLVLDAATVRAHAISPATIATVAQARARELAASEREFRGERPPVDLRNRRVIVVDDGRTDLATWRTTVTALQ